MAFTNEILFVLYTLVSYSGVILINRIAGKDGLIGWIALAVVIANTSMASLGNVFGIPGFSFGSIIFTTIFLALNILQDDYGKDSTKNAIRILVFSSLVFTILMAINSYLIPEDYDTTTTHLKSLFTI